MKWLYDPRVEFTFVSFLIAKYNTLTKIVQRLAAGTGTSTGLGKDVQVYLPYSQLSRLKNLL